MNLVIIGNYGALNTGDEMILQGLKSFVADCFKKTNMKCNITVLSGDPEKVRVIHNINALPLFPAGIRSKIKMPIIKKSKSYHVLVNADLVIIGGGGLFGGPEARGNKIWLKQSKIAIKAEKPLFMMGQSIGNISDKRMEKEIAEIFKDAELITVRDRESVELLKKWGVKISHYYPDFAFYPQLKANKKRSQSKEIIVALRQMRKMPKEFIYETTSFLKRLQQQDYALKFIDFQTNNNSDSKLHHRIISQLRQKNIIHIKGGNLNEIYDHFSQARFAVCMRLHSAITALRTSTPFIAINYHNKVKNLLNTLELSENIIDFDKVTEDLLMEKFDHIKSITPPDFSIQFQDFQNEFMKKLPPVVS